MERYPKLFLLAAIGYLLAGVLLGLHLTHSATNPYITRFVHVHLNLLGFMAMFIYGVAYHILPRFNAKPITHPSLVRAHFYLVNVGLIGMASTALAGGLTTEGFVHVLFILSAITEATGIVIFAYNIIPVLAMEQPAPIAAPAVKETPTVEEPPAITGDMKVSAALDEYPGLLDEFVRSGFKALANPAARATFAKIITISQACKVHRVNAEEFLGNLNSALKEGKATAQPQPSAAPAKPEPTPEKKAEETMATGKKIARGELAEAETLVGSLIEVYPESKTVFEKHYGAGCFSCPGQAFETVSQTAMMHGIEAKIILDEINEIIKNTQS